MFIDVKSRDPLVVVFGPFGLPEAFVRLHGNGELSSVQPVVEGSTSPVYVLLKSNRSERARARRWFTPLPKMPRKVDQYLKAPHLWTLVAIKNAATRQQGELEAPQHRKGLNTEGKNFRRLLNYLLQAMVQTGTNRLQLSS